MKNYSPFFETLYDETGPVGSLGRGTHYSVLESVALAGADDQPLQELSVHRLAVIWDEDHDQRVIVALNRIYRRSLLSKFCFIGERKGGLTLLLDPFHQMERTERVRVHAEVEAICEDIDGDYWPFEIGAMTSEDFVSPIADVPGKVQTYLQNIYNIWGLGLRQAPEHLFGSPPPTWPEQSNA